MMHPSFLLTPELSPLLISVTAIHTISLIPSLDSLSPAPSAPETSDLICFFSFLNEMELFLQSFPRFFHPNSELTQRDHLG